MLFVFIPLNYNLSLGSLSNHGLKQDKITANTLLNALTVITCIFILEFPISLAYYIFHFNFEVPITRPNFYKYCHKMTKLSTLSLSIIMFHLATGKTSQILCLIVLQISCSILNGNKSVIWLPFILIILSNDIELNPGQNIHHNFLSVMTWNLNSLTKDNFNRVQLIEAHNSLFNYDLIAVNETCLNDTIEIPETLLENYTFINANSAANHRHGGVGLF